MLDIKYLRQNVEFVRRKMLERGQEMDFGPFIAMDAKRLDILHEVELLRNERNTASKEIGEKKQRKEDASALIARMGKSPHGSGNWMKLSRKPRPNSTKWA